MSRHEVRDSLFNSITSIVIGNSHWAYTSVIYEDCSVTFCFMFQSLGNCTKTMLGPMLLILKVAKI